MSNIVEMITEQMWKLTDNIENLANTLIELRKENKELKEKLDKIEKARIKYEDVFYKVTRQWDDNYGELDEIIMNR